MALTFTSAQPETTPGDQGELLAHAPAITRRPRCGLGTAAVSGTIYLKISIYSTGEL